MYRNDIQETNKKSERAYTEEYKKFCNSEEKEIKSIQVLNNLKRSSIAEHLVSHPICANNYNRDRFNINKICNNVLI